MPKEDRTIDHKVARADGGTDALDNLQLAHKACNEDRSKAWMAANIPGYNARRNSRQGKPMRPYPDQGGSA